MTVNPQEQEFEFPVIVEAPDGAVVAGNTAALGDSAPPGSRTAAKYTAMLDWALTRQEAYWHQEIARAQLLGQQQVARSQMAAADAQAVTTASEARSLAMATWVLSVATVVLAIATVALLLQ